MLFVLNSLSVGGSETKIVKIANALAHSGVRVEIAYLNPPETLLDQVDPAVSVTNLRRRGKYSVNSLRRLRDVIKREKDVVVAVNLYPLLYVIPAVKWWKSSGVSVAGLVNTSISIGRERLLEKFYAAFLKQCDQIVFGCQNQRHDWVDKHNLSMESSQVIYNGVDYEFFSPTGPDEDAKLLRRKFGIPGDATVIGSVGRFCTEKSFNHLIMALANLGRSGRESYGVLVGEGEERDRLRTVATEEGIADKIKFLGLQRDVRAALSIMDIFVLPSSAVETFSNAALEAMAMARPVVLSKIGGAAEMVEHGVSGMLFPAGNVDELTRILCTLHDSKDMRQNLGIAARETVVKSFGFPIMVDRYRELSSFSASQGQSACR